MGKINFYIMKIAIAALLGYVSAISISKKESPDCPTSQEAFSYNERVATATGFLQLSACSSSGINGAGLSCVPDNQFFATGMNGDEDLAEDIIMKGEPYHYNQKKQKSKFATGMNGDEDLGEDIIMKGEPYHYNQKQKKQALFATGMNGDEDLGEDIIMKGEPYHYNQRPANKKLFATGMNGDEDL